MKKIKDGIEVPFQIMNDGMVAMGRQLYLLDDKDLKGEVMARLMNPNLWYILVVLRCIVI